MGFSSASLQGNRRQLLRLETVGDEIRITSSKAGRISKIAGKTRIIREVGPGLDCRVVAEPLESRSGSGSHGVAGNVVMLKLPRILDLIPDAVDPLFQSFEDVHVKHGDDDPPCWYKLGMGHP